MIKWRCCSHRSGSNRVSTFSKIRTSYHWLTFSGALILGLVPLEGRGAKVVSQEDLARLPSGRPAVVYVQDFKVEKQSSSEDQQSLGGGRARAIIAEVKSATGMQSSQVVDLMSSSLVSDLNRGGVKAVRLATGATLPKSGWVVRGVFTEVDQGSRMLRAEVGFGAGATDLAVLVNVADLQKGKVEPFYGLETQAGSRKMPGGAPMAIVTKNPYVAAAKFVMSRRDLPKNIRQTAQTIADQIIRRAQQ
ncbi:MAG TPA: DUF4410 domain-containing protein [Chthoniobacterales bacterium]|nr:DUF4410 domain-containing protein [Chthoniobacterales bacterium]